MKDKTLTMNRRTMMAGALALPLVTVLKYPASAAEFTLKYANGQDPTHPVNTRAKEAFDRIREATSGKVDIKLYPAAQLGSDTDLLAQVRSGAIDFFNLSSLVLATFVPLSGITSLGFAFKNYDQVWQAMDGELGAHIREMIGKTPIFAMSKIWDNGFRQISSSTKEIKTPDDLKGFKLRVPPAPALTSLFKALDASPSPINFNELYSALQTKVVEGQENPLAIIGTARLYEVQKSISLTNHVWDGYWVLGNKSAFARLPKDAQDVISREFDHSALDQRADIARLSESLKVDLKAKGINMIDVKQDDFRAVLGSTSFYADWKQKYGADAWKSLEKVSGPLIK